jgi:phage tail-like protein
MGIKIEDFKAALTNGYRPNLYQMEVMGMPEKLVYMCKATQLPGKTIGIVEAPYLGMKAKLAGDVVYEDLSVTVIMDNDFGVRTALENWMATAKANEAAIGLDAALYKRTAEVIALDNGGHEIAQYSFIGCWPSSVAPVDLSYETNDTLAEYVVTFTYDYWTRIL